MGVIFVTTKRFKMKASLLVAVVLIFAIAVATKVEKKSRAKGGRDGGSAPNGPPCVDRKQVYLGKNIISRFEAKTLLMCLNICNTNPLCNFWSWYYPNPMCSDCEPQHDILGFGGVIKTHDCFHFSDRSPALYTHNGFHSGKRGCTG